MRLIEIILTVTIIAAIVRNKDDFGPAQITKLILTIIITMAIIILDFALLIFFWPVGIITTLVSIKAGIKYIKKLD